jgi:uncharacterized membrane protein YczE
MNKDLYERFIKSPRHLIMSFVGVAFLGVTVAFLTKSNLGVDPWTCCVTGVGSLFKMPYSTFYPIMTGLFFVAVIFLDRKLLGIATIFNLIGVGTVAGLVRMPLDYFFPQVVLYQQIIFLIIALTVLCVATSLYMTADLGVSAYDAAAIIISKKTKFQFRWCRIFTDLVCVIVGFLLGARIGVGTVITALCMGPFTQWCCTHIAEPLLYGKKDSTN